MTDSDRNDGGKEIRCIFFLRGIALRTVERLSHETHRPREGKRQRKLDAAI